MPLTTVATPSEVLALAEELFVVDLDTPAGRVTSEVDELRTTADGAFIRVRQAVDGDDLVASPQRRVQVDRDGRVTVVHSRYGVEHAGPRRPRGVGGRYVAATLGRCRRAGVERAIVCAQKVGGYAWARSGFQFDGRTTRDAVAGHLDRIAGGHRPDELRRAEAPAPADPDGLRDLAGRVRDGEADAGDVADFGRGRGPGFWHDGRLALLGCHWDGVLTFS